MNLNNFDLWNHFYCVWNAVREALLRLVFQTRKAISLAGILSPGICIALLGYSVISAPSAEGAGINQSGNTKVNFISSQEARVNVPAIIEKAEHLIQKDQSNPGSYSVDDPEYHAAFTPSGVIYYQKQNGRVSDNSRLEFALESVRLSYKNTLLPYSSAMSVVENKLINQRHSGIKEVYEAKRGGVEQSWVIDAPLSDNPSDIIIQEKLTTSLLSKPNKQGGIDFLDKDGKYFTTYGEIIVIDSNNKRLTVAPVYNGFKIMITIPADWLAQAAYPVVIDPLIGSNVQVDNLTTTDNYPAIAFGTTNYLIAWQTGTPNATGTGTTAIRGVRVSSAGTILDATPLLIGDTASRDDEFPSVTYDSVNSRFIVVWMSWNTTTSANINGRTVGESTGTVATAFTALAGGTRIFAYPSVACCDINNNYYVVYGRGGNNATNFTQYFGQTYNRNTHAAATASNPTATVSSGTITPNTEPKSAPKLYSLSTTKYLNTWETFGVDANGDVSANLLTVTAAPLYTWGTQVSVAAAAATLERYPRAAFDGTNALIVYQLGATTSADIYGRFVTPGAANLTLGTAYAISAVAGNEQSYPNVAYTAGTCSATPINRYMVVWKDFRNNATNPDIYGSTMTTAGVVETAVALSTNITYIKQLPAIAADSGSCGYLTSWSDYRNNATTSSDIYAQRIGYPNISNLSPASGAVGATISVNGLNFGTDPGAGNRSTASDNVALNGTQLPDANITSWSDSVITFTIPNGTTAGTYPVTTTAGSWTSNSSNLTVTVPAIQITTVSLANGYQWMSYGANVSATGGVTPYTWSIISGSLPAGLTLNSNSGLISGTPSASGTFNITVQVTDSTTPTPQTATQPLSILIYGLTTITVTPANPAILQGQTIQFTATGTYSDTTNSDISSIVAWGSTNTSVATINSTGLATGIVPGSITISATK